MDINKENIHEKIQKLPCHVEIVIRSSKEEKIVGFNLTKISWYIINSDTLTLQMDCGRIFYIDRYPENTEKLIRDIDDGTLENNLLAVRKPSGVLGADTFDSLVEYIQCMLAHMDNPFGQIRRFGFKNSEETRS